MGSRPTESLKQRSRKQARVLVLSFIYSCPGKHFKVYHSGLEEVLEHESDEKPVLVTFSHNDVDLLIAVSGFVKRRMRLEKQKDRGDIYILQDKFKPFLLRLNQLLRTLNVKADQEEPWRFRQPIAREGRQGVPNLTKLAEVSQVSLMAPFDDQVFRIQNGYLVVDSEIPSSDQSKWYSEGAERQIHLGIFGFSRSLAKEKTDNKVVITIPLEKIKKSFVQMIEKNWVE